MLRRHHSLICVFFQRLSHGPEIARGEDRIQETHAPFIVINWHSSFSRLWVEWKELEGFLLVLLPPGVTAVNLRQPESFNVTYKQELQLCSREHTQLYTADICNQPHCEPWLLPSHRVWQLVSCNRQAGQNRGQWGVIRQASMLLCNLSQISVLHMLTPKHLLSDVDISVHSPCRSIWWLCSNCLELSEAGLMLACSLNIIKNPQIELSHKQHPLMVR